MHKNILITLIESFSLQEINRFNDYLNSPYFNKSKILADAFALLKRYSTPARLTGNIESGINKKIFIKLYPGEKFNDARMRNIFSKLHKEALRFLVYEKFTVSKVEHKKYLLTVIDNKHLIYKWEKIIKDYEVEYAPLIDSSYFLNKHIIESYKFNFSYLNRKITKLKQTKIELGYIDKSVINLLLYFIMELVSLYITNRIYTHQYNVIPGNNILNSLIQNDIIRVIKLSINKKEENYFIIDIYLTAVEMYSNVENVKLYKRYKYSVFNNLGKFSKDEINFHFINLVTYLIIKLQSKEIEKIKNELFEVYKFMLDKEYYLSSSISHLPHEIFRNILFHGLRMKEFKWVNDFIRIYSKKVHPDNIRNMECYGYAYLSFYEGRYGESLKHLNEIDLNYFLYKFDAKNLTLMLYFELGYIEESLSLIKSYKEFLRHNELISSEKNNRYINFIKFFEKLILYKSSNKKADIEHLKYLIEKSKSLAFQGWLLEKTSTFLT